MLNEKIKNFYDQSTPLWLHTWGEHMHHGYFPKGQKVNTESIKKSQTRLVEELLAWAKIEQAEKILDAGCGVGGSARFLAQRFGASAIGITLSPLQAQEGEALTKAAELENQVTIQSGDLMEMKSSTERFNLIWIVECSEHLSDKKAMMEMFYKLLLPQGRLVLSSWCHRDEPPALKKSEIKLLKKVSHLFHFPALTSLYALENFAAAAGFEKIETADWSENIVPFWKAVIQSAFRPSSVIRLLQAGWLTIKGAWALRYMIEGHRKGVVKYGVLQATKG